MSTEVLEGKGACAKSGRKPVHKRMTIASVFLMSS